MASSKVDSVIPILRHKPETVGIVSLPVSNPCKYSIASLVKSVRSLRLARDMFCLVLSVSVSPLVVIFLFYHVMVTFVCNLLHFTDSLVEWANIHIMNDKPFLSHYRGTFPRQGQIRCMILDN